MELFMDPDENKSGTFRGLIFLSVWNLVQPDNGWNIILYNYFRFFSPHKRFGRTVAAEFILCMVHKSISELYLIATTERQLQLVWDALWWNQQQLQQDI